MRVRITLSAPRKAFSLTVVDYAEAVEKAVIIENFYRKRNPDFTIEDAIIEAISDVDTRPAVQTGGY